MCKEFMLSVLVWSLGLIASLAVLWSMLLWVLEQKLPFGRQ